MNSAERLQQLIKPAVEAMGFVFVGLEYMPSHKRGLLRVYIDHAEGISADNCAEVSYQVSGVLDVADLIKDRYTLEISSPGLARPLFTRQHYEQFIGSAVKLRLQVPMHERRQFTGILKGLHEESVAIEEAEQLYLIPLSNIAKAHLVPDYTALLGKRGKR